MRPIRSTTLTVLASALMATTLTGCEFTSEPQDTSEIVIAADLELSGAAASTGKAYQRALELKVEQINESGGLGGRKIRLAVKDNRSDPAESLRNIGDFTNDATVSAIIMGGCNECAIGAANTVNDKKVPTIALAPATKVANPVAERRYMFKLAPNANDSAAALAAELKRKNVKKVALLHTDDDYGTESSVLLEGELDKADIKLSRQKTIKATDTDVNQAVKSLVDGPKVDALVIWTPAEQAMLAANAATSSKFSGQLFFDASAAGDLFLGGDGKSRATDDATMVFTQTMVIDDVIATTPAKASRKQWFRAYTARYGGYYGFSSFAADAVQLIVDSVLRAKGTAGALNRDGIRDVLETSQLEGLSGPIRMTPDNHSGLMPQALTTLVARGGRWRLAG
ncbi:ABC transporter substrate-binding protein [Micromonospora sonneratiae]|uniref:ABC transporter substrate-binding protein n=1 Tax=Micromonospora sonneratiae TaxID=1184706 RepID=A0ABW3YIL5_9ACTN